jgi:hypothetical protein
MFFFLIHTSKGGQFFYLGVGPGWGDKEYSSYLVIFHILSFFVEWKTTTNFIGQNTAKAAVIQVIHVPSLDNTEYQVHCCPARTIVLDYFAPKWPA